MRLAGGAAVAAAAGPLVHGLQPTRPLDLAGCRRRRVAPARPRWPTSSPGVVTTDEKLNTFEQITSYNNFYEFGTGKDDPQRYAGRLKTSPWKVKIDGHCNKPADYLLEDLIKPHAARGARLPPALRRRLVDGDPVDRHSAEPRSSSGREPTSKATFVEFTTLLRPSEMPGQNTADASSGRTSKGCGWTKRCTR